MPRNETHSGPRRLAARGLTPYLMLTATALLGIAALFFGAGITGDDDSAGIATFTALAVAIAIPGAGMAAAAFMLSRAGR